MTPTSIRVTDDGIVYSSTAGGLLQFNSETQEFNVIKTEEGLLYLDLTTVSIDQQGRLWMGGAYPQGCLQVYDTDKGLVKYFEDDLIESINHIEIGEDIAFAVYKGTTSGDIGILKFDLNIDGIPEYKEYYNDFSAETVLEIHDLDIFGDSLYVTTDKGIFVGEYSDYLKFSINWHQIPVNIPVKQFVPAESPFIVGDNLIQQRVGDVWVDYSNCINDIGNIIQAETIDGKIGILTEEYYYEIIDLMTCEINSFPISTDNQIRIGNAFDYSVEGNVFIGIKDQGIMYLNRELGSKISYTPNTTITNAFHAITITESGNLAATSHFGTLYYNGIDYKNYIPNNYYEYYPASSETFHVVSINYHPQDDIKHFPISIIEKDNGNLIFCNSGSFPEYGTVIELDLTTDIMTKYDDTEEIIDGWDGIYLPGIHSHYMLVNQIEKDIIGNIWVVNPFSEKYGNLLAIQSAIDNTWSHVGIPDNSSFLPQTIAFQKRTSSSQRAWIGFAYQTLENSTIYSAGGIKILNNAIVSSDGWEDTTWISISNPNVLPGNDPDASVWSLVFDEMNILWVLSEKGVQGYEVSGNNEITLDPLRTYINDQNEQVSLNFLTQYSFVKGNRIRVDSQNNKWITSRHGVWIIQESMEYWPSEEGLNTDNSGLLSDIVYDVAFDNDKGLAYLATEKGISILQIPFADNPTEAEDIYLSPNPFIIPDDEFITIKNVPAGSTIQIMTITGSLIKTINMETHISQATWDGRNRSGEVVGTAVYLVAAYHPRESNKVSKVAVIRK